MGQPPPDQVVWGLVNSHTLARCVQVVAEVGVADALEDQAASAAELAKHLGVNADALNRTLRLLSAHGVFASSPDGYTHTPSSRLLRTDHPQSLRSFARMIGMPVIWNAFTELPLVMQTGRPALDWAGLLTYFADHPEEASLFNQAMVGKSASIVPAVVAAYDFTPFRLIADIGGGRGHLLREILKQAPAASGVLFELPHVVADAAEIASARLRLQAGDFFVDPLPAADAYVLMEVIHDWADEEAGKILAAVRRVAPRHARLLIVEALVSEAPGPQFGKMLDIIMLAVTGGRERTPAEYEALLNPAGFRLNNVISTPSPYSVVEAAVV
jgi:O-methyltransferase domain